MNEIRGYWRFEGLPYDNYSSIRESLRVLMENLISSKILLPNRFGDIPLEYSTVDELLDQIEASGYLQNGSELNFYGDTVIYTLNGEEVWDNIVSVDCFSPSSQFFYVAVMSDHWLPVMMERETYAFDWNIELYQLNYPRLPAFLEKLHEELGWKDENLLCKDSNFATIQAGYDLFIEESVVIREYKTNPNPAFDLDAYLAAIKNAKALAPG
jgi:hypothetical protein